MTKQLSSKEKLIFALDVDSIKKAEYFIEQLKNEVGMFKVGNQLFTNCGKSIMELLNKNEGKVFLDLKYHDIPNTVAAASVEVMKFGVSMFNVHSLGGYEMMARSVEAVNERCQKEEGLKPIILAVTILTSISNDTLKEIGIQKDMEDQIISLTHLAERAGVDGVVASPKDVEVIRKNTKEDFVIVTPGVRPLWAEKDDHQRFLSPGDAVKNGSDYIVVGRPIRKAEDPVLAARKICQEIEGTMLY